MEVILTALTKVVQNCWTEAEEKTREAVGRYFGPSEETLTFLFARELGISVEHASQTRKVERAFLDDLRKSIFGIPDLTVERAAGLIARVNFHTRYHEGNLSAADLGLVIRRPFVTKNATSLKIELREDHATGLLAQAKLGTPAKTKPNSYTWGYFTDNQQDLYSKRCDYYSLLLYRLAGDKKGDLKPFMWQLCHGYDLDTAQQWLSSDDFPNERPSSVILKDLFAGKIGTTKLLGLKDIIDPGSPGSCTIEIQIFWPDHKKPPKSIYVKQSHHIQQVLRH